MSANDARGVELKPCPNPWCNAMNTRSIRSHLDSRWVRCKCGVTGPVSANREAAIAAWNTRAVQNDRLMDLVRHQRHALYDEKLISNEEFAALVADSESGQRVARLETYDKLTAQVALLEKRVSVLTRALASTDSARQKFLDERDLLEKRCEALSKPVSLKEIEMPYRGEGFVGFANRFNTIIASRTTAQPS